MDKYTLETPVEKLSGIGPSSAQKLRGLGIHNIKELLLYLPYRYDDLSQIKPISSLVPSESTIIKGKITSIDSTRSWRSRICVTNALLTDSDSSIELVWFNQPYISRVLKIGDEIIALGKAELSHRGGLRLVFQVKSYERLESHQSFVQKIIPVYSEKPGMSSKWFRARIRSILPVAESIPDWLPEKIKDFADLLDLHITVTELHHPTSQTAIKDARRRLAFDEILTISLRNLLAKKEFKGFKAQRLVIHTEALDSFVQDLSFKLTVDQVKTLDEIKTDIAKNQPMNRIVQGDVGSGKTIVAGVVLLNTLLEGFSGAVIAPTEVLAYQHFQSFLKLYEKYDLPIYLLTNSYSLIGRKGQYVKTTKKDLYELLKDTNQPYLALGTHALIQDKVSLPKVVLVVIDEQHRFGVKQRAALKSKTEVMPHLLSMTATPIPRTLSLALYGDLDISQIKSMPEGRKPIKTRVVSPDKRQAAYNFIQRHINQGRQVFVICPLIDESDKLGYKSVTQEFEKLDKEIFPHLRIGLLHGRLKSAEKENVMTKFKSGEINILVATSVIEVGVDVPNANIMMIEGADRFGLAQLHQFRGRVGRDIYQSFCLLFSDTASESALKRLMIMEATSDGFELAEFDLEMRGPGEVYGTKQHGIPDLKFGSLLDYDLIKLARDAANLVIDDIDEYPKVIDEVGKLESSRHLE